MIVLLPSGVIDSSSIPSVVISHKDKTAEQTKFTRDGATTVSHAMERRLF